jgi:hypothetical protein
MSMTVRSEIVHYVSVECDHCRRNDCESDSTETTINEAIWLGWSLGNNGETACPSCYATLAEDRHQSEMAEAAYLLLYDTTKPATPVEYMGPDDYDLWHRARVAQGLDPQEQEDPDVWRQQP